MAEREQSLPGSKYIKVNIKIELAVPQVGTAANDKQYTVPSAVQLRVIRQAGVPQRRHGCVHPPLFPGTPPTTPAWSGGCGGRAGG